MKQADTGMNGRAQILEHLRSGPGSVNDLASILGVTPNAIRSQLALLTGENLVEVHGQRKGKRRPETLYRLTSEGEEVFPKAYVLLLQQTIESMRMELSAKAFTRLLNRIGQDLAERLSSSRRAAQLPLSPSEAIEMLAGIGGSGSLEQEGETPVFYGTGCPFSAVVSEQPHVCMIAASLLSELTGLAVADACDHSMRPKCIFRFESAE